MSEIKVAGLYTYPIKSCGAAEAETVQFSDLGIRNDREMMLVGNRGQFISQRTHPELAVVTTEITRDFQAAKLLVNAPGMGDLELDLESLDHYANPEVQIDLFKKPGKAREESKEASGYFSEYLKKEVRLMVLTGARTIKPECQVEGASVQTGFADGFPILLTSVESLDDLNEKMAEPVAMSRFRPNIVVEGAPAYDEDFWRELRIGDLQAYVVRACARCPMPNIDQSVGMLPIARPVAQALRKHRFGLDAVTGTEGEFFGQNVTHVFVDGMTLSIGEEVVVIDRSEKRNLTLY